MCSQGVSVLKFSRFESTRLGIFPLSRTIGNSLFLLRNLNLLKFSIKSVRVQTLSPMTLSSRALICRVSVISAFGSRIMQMIFSIHEYLYSRMGIVQKSALFSFSQQSLTVIFFPCSPVSCSGWSQSCRDWCIICNTELGTSALCRAKWTNPWIQGKFCINCQPPPRRLQE